MTPVMAAPARDPRSEYSEDTEITLGTGKMLALFFGLVVLCATFFGMGYSIGHNSAKTNAELLPSPSTSRPARLSTPITAIDSSAGGRPNREQTCRYPASCARFEQYNQFHYASPDQRAGAARLHRQQPVASYFVQVAAVSKQEDAQALVESLKGRQYQAFIADATPDKLFHVQVGPFTDVKEAESMRARLVNDGYNPILKK